MSNTIQSIPEARLLLSSLRSVGYSEDTAIELKTLFDNFISENKIDTNDLSSFKISNIDEYEAQTERFDFDGFDDKFYEDENLHQQIIDYARKHVEQLIVE